MPLSAYSQAVLSVELVIPIARIGTGALRRLRPGHDGDASDGSELRQLLVGRPGRCEHQELILDRGLGACGGAAHAAAGRTTNRVWPGCSRISERGCVASTRSRAWVS